MPRTQTYDSLLAQLSSVLEECTDFVSAMASTAALLHDAFEGWFWVGFYLPADDGSLVVGPYQGPLACVRLPPGQGVCGAAARSLESLVVPDVHAFAGHIACSPRSRSEIVVPVLQNGRLIAVLDIDSDRPAAFDDVDRRNLEALAAVLAERHGV